MEISSSLALPLSSSSSSISRFPFSSSRSTFFSTASSLSISDTIKTTTTSSRCDVRRNPLVIGVPRIRPSRARRGFRCNALFGLGVPELVVIAGVAALVFGPKKLPEVGRSIGKTVKSFQQAAKEFESELKKEPDSSEPSTSDPKAIGEEKNEDTVSSSKESV